MSGAAWGIVSFVQWCLLGKVVVRWVARLSAEDPGCVRSGSKRFPMNGMPPPSLCCQDPFSKGGRAFAQGARKLTVGFMILVRGVGQHGWHAGWQVFGNLLVTRACGCGCYEFRANVMTFGWWRAHAVL